MLEEKDYTKWHEIKTMEHNSSLGDNRGLNYREGQVYWASIGQNNLAQHCSVNLEHLIQPAFMTVIRWAQQAVAH